MSRMDDFGGEIGRGRRHSGNDSSYVDFDVEVILALTREFIHRSSRDSSPRPVVSGDITERRSANSNIL